jgi:U4/U6.U5 small nuclear ribonucleoproteins
VTFITVGTVPVVTQTNCGSFAPPQSSHPATSRLLAAAAAITDTCYNYYYFYYCGQFEVEAHSSGDDRFIFVFIPLRSGTSTRYNHGNAMSERSPDNDNDDGDFHRTTKRRRREGEYDPTTFQTEREARMARLRQEMEEEDNHLLETRNQDDLQEHERIKPQDSIIEVNQEDLEGLDEEEQMKKLLGFDGFGSTKGEAVQDNQNSAARGAAAKNKARKYRQYMNRKNGFNRPLEKMD